MKQNIKVALVYDRVNTPYGGAEKVLLSLQELFPSAPLYTSLYNPKKAQWAHSFEVKASFLNSIPFFKDNHQLIAFLMPLAFESFDFAQYDLVISITSAEAKGIITMPQTTHLCYLLTPPRYLYSHKHFYLQKSRIFSLPIIKNISLALLDYLKKWDQIAIHRPDTIIPISDLVRKRAQKYYKLAVESPLYPSVNSEPAATTKNPLTKVAPKKSYILMVTRLVPYKKIDLAIQACQELDQKLIIVGTGKEKAALKSNIIKPDLITIKENVSAEALEKLYTNCLAVLMPGEEDFGIVALEALSYQKPVIINAKSGAAELIEDKKSGLLLKKADLQDIKSRLLEARKYDFKPVIMDRCVSTHNQTIFKKQFRKAVENAIQKNTL